MRKRVDWALLLSDNDEEFMGWLKLLYGGEPT